MSLGRRVLGLVMLAAGIAMTVVGVLVQQVPAATVGGLLSFLGIAALSTTMVPALISRTGIVLARLAGPVGELAAGNAGRNPRRTAATVTALLIGVALTSTLVVGIATVKSSAPAAMDEQFPVDVMVSSAGNRGLPPALGPRITATTGVWGFRRSSVPTWSSMAVANWRPSGCRAVPRSPCCVPRSPFPHRDGWCFLPPDCGTTV